MDYILVLLIGLAVGGVVSYILYKTLNKAVVASESALDAKVVEAETTLKCATTSVNQVVDNIATALKKDL